MIYKKLINQMPLADKIALCSGANFWNTKAFDKYGIPSVMMCDGPHGLRKQEKESDHIGVNLSKPATCFPASCATGSSWDRELLKEIGRAIAGEALCEGVSIVLGPGINIKRNPLCGRNFEYLSEDPYAAGELGAAFIQGVEELGVGASLKHFAANSQETRRFNSDSILEERTLREIYLASFETAVKKGKPSTVMCAYNKINGVYCSDNRYLLREILREEWGFEGAVVTDWGAMNDRIAAFEAGTDLEMPGGVDYFNEEVMQAVKTGKFSEERINEAVDRMLALIFKSYQAKEKKSMFDPVQHHGLARRAAAESAILLKNDVGVLPLDKKQKIAVIGQFAKAPRYQGSGSSHINPVKLTNVLDTLKEKGYAYEFYEGCKKDGTTTEALLQEAAQGAKKCDAAVVFAGLTENLESEGFDRESMSMPEGHICMIREVAGANPNTVVVLMAGSPVEMPWLNEVKSVLHIYLPGEAGGEAAVDLLYGDANPCGKLSESYPISYRDVPSAGFYENGGIQAQYREGIYVGYRYYDKAGVEVCFPFGYGLSYTTFEYSDFHTWKDGENIEVEVSVKNTGKTAGAEIVQLYVSDMQQGIHRPEKELKGFEKVFLEPGELKRIRFVLDKRAFAYYDEASKDWQVPKGGYNIQIASSSRDIRLSGIMELEGTTEPLMPGHLKGTWYETLRGRPEKKDLETALRREIGSPETVRRKSYTMEHCIKDMQDSFVMRMVFRTMEWSIGKSSGGVDYNNPAFKMSVISSTEVPMKNLCIVSSGAMKRNVAEGLVHMANGRFIKGLKAMRKKK